MTLDQITACIVCCNEGDRLGPCLASLDWVDEIIVLDLESTDNSRDLAAAAGARVLSHPPVPIVELVRNTLASAAAHDWILVLDPDERVTPGLADALRAVAGDDGVDAVVLPRMNIDLGFPPTHWSQRYEPQLRLYRRSRVRWPEVPNALPSVPSSRVHHVTASDDHVLVHDRSRTIAEVLERSVRYAPIQAASMLEQGQRFTARAMIAALWKEIRTKLIEPRAWTDGVPGVLRAGILINVKFYVWAELWRQSGVGRTASDDRVVRVAGAPLDALSMLLRVGRWFGHPRLPSDRRARRRVSGR